MHTATFRMTLYAQRIVAVIHYGDFFGQQFPIVREDLIGWKLKVAGMLQIVDIGDIFLRAKLHEKFKKLRTAV